jgi:hypothetical protein
MDLWLIVTSVVPDAAATVCDATSPHGNSGPSTRFLPMLRGHRGAGTRSRSTKGPQGGVDSSSLTPAEG